MKQTLNFYQFADAFKGDVGANRSNNFSYEGKRALFDYLEEYEDSTGEEVELDIVALCCDFTEYENIEEFRNEYGDEYESIEDIENRTQVIRVGDEGFIIQVF